MPTLRETPYGAFNFLVSFGAGDATGAAAGFSEVTGLDQEVQLVEYRAGNDRSAAPRIIAGLARPVTVTLRRGVVGDTTVQEWIRTSLAGIAEPRDVQVDLLSEDRSETVQRWRLARAIPVKLSGPTLNAMVSAIAVETLVLVAESLRVE